MRFTTKGGVIYAIVLGKPAATLRIRALGAAAALLEKPIATVRLLGSDEPVLWSRSNEALPIEAPHGTVTEEAIIDAITAK